jgi:hypothetical protein
MSKTVVLNVTANTKDAQKEIKQVTKEVQETNKATTELTSAFDQATGGFISKGKGAIATVQNLGKGFLGAGANATKMGNLIKIALTSTGIGALLVAFGSLLTFFTKTQRGVDQVKQAFEGFQAGVSVVIDRISSLGEALTLLFSGDFKGALEATKNSFKGLGDEIREEVAAARELEAAFQRLRDREIELIVSNAELRKAIAEDKLLAEDRTRSYNDRLEALDRVLAAEDKLLQQSLEIAREEARISAERLALGESSREDIRANEEAQARVIQLEAESLVRQKESFTRRQALLQEAQTAEENAVKEQFRLRTEANKIVEDVNELSFARFQNRIAAETRLVKDNLAEQLSAYQDVKLKEQQQDKITNSQKLQLVSQTFGAIAGILGENSKAGKAAAIAQATINTYEGITQVWKSDSVLPEPFATAQKIISTGTVLASGLQAVRTIKAQPLPQVRVAGGFGGGGGSAAPATPSPPSFNVVGASAGNQIAEAIAGNEQKPIKAFVVSREVTSAQELDRNAVRDASI